MIISLCYASVTYVTVLAVTQGRSGVSCHKLDSIVKGSRNYRTDHFIVNRTLWGLIRSLTVNFLLVNLSRVTGVHVGTLELVETYFSCK